MTETSRPCLQGSPRIPGDKSISHRYALLAAAGIGPCRILNYSPSQDCASTLRCLHDLGVSIDAGPEAILIRGTGQESWKQPSHPLDAGNSGTLMRLLAGLLAGLPLSVIVTGDASLRSRPMKRICEPLTLMGAHILTRDRYRPPLIIQGGHLTGISYRTPMASAQVKSCILLAGLGASGLTRVQEPAPSRDHTERALPIFGARIEQKNGWIQVQGTELQNPPEVEVPADFSAATFFILAALLAPGSRLWLRNVGTNPTRTALLRLLLEAGAGIDLGNFRSPQNEPVNDLEVRYSPKLLESFPGRLEGSVVPNLIDEFPALAILGTQLAKGLTVREATELRHKECDRIQAIVHNLRTLGVDAQEFPDGFYVPPSPRLRGGKIRTFGDHRIAMAFSLASLWAQGDVELDDRECVAVSFPDFFAEFAEAGGHAFS